MTKPASAVLGGKFIVGFGNFVVFFQKSKKHFTAAGGRVLEFERQTRRQLREQNEIKRRDDGNAIEGGDRSKHK